MQDGGSLLLSGGESTFSSFAGTAVETLSPVSFDYTSAEGDGIALMLVLDCSSSMSNQNGYNSRSGKNGRNNHWNNWGDEDTTAEDTAESLSMAKQGAIRSIEALTANDAVGIVSFNSRATLQAELSPATDAQKAVLSRVISGLNTSQGTYYCDALELAWEQLKTSDAAVKHVIFLSDGEPSDWGYDSLVQQMAADGITVSTIALGYSSSVLEEMAREGGGRYYAVTGVSDLPDIMLDETEQVAADPLIEENTEVYLNGGIPSGLPAVGGYIGTTLKEDSELKLQAANGDPILASHTVGSGRVMAFTSDLTGSWTAAWRVDETGLTRLRQIVTEHLTAAAETESDTLLGGTEKQEARTVDLLYPIGLMILLLMLVDIAIRRLRWKDIRMLFSAAR